MVDTFTRALTETQREAIDCHFDPRSGSAYWLERLKYMGFGADYRCESIEDVHALGPMDEQAMRERPLKDFIPRSVQAKKIGWVRSETGGATGQVKRGVFTPEEFEASFVTPFVRAAQIVAFPSDGPWLFIGPGGPHIIGRAAMAIARAYGNNDPFMIDFDPRWFRKLAAGSFARSRYMQHMIAQVLDIIRREDVEILFATPAVLDEIAPQMTDAERSRIHGVHYGGMAMTSEQYRRYRKQWFPNAVHLSGYGNSLFGCCLEVPRNTECSIIDYYLPHDQWQIELVDQIHLNNHEILPVEEGHRGRVLAHRFSKSQLILNLIERDEATSMPPAQNAIEHGFVHGNLIDPGPVTCHQGQIDRGIY